MISRCLPAVVVLLFGLVLLNVGWTQEPTAIVKQKDQPDLDRRVAELEAQIGKLTKEVQGLRSRLELVAEKQGAKATKLSTDLIGTWTLAEAATPGTPSGVGSRLKFFTGTHWMITQPDPKTGEVVFHHGGRYTIAGDTLATSIDFANGSTASLIGNKHDFKIAVDGDTFKQTGINNPYTETWKRVK